MTLHKAGITAIAIVSAIAGAGITLWWQSSRASLANLRGRTGEHVREEFVPAQDLSLTDGAGAPVGRVNVSDGDVTLYLYTGRESSVLVRVYSDSSRVYVACQGNEDETGVIVSWNRTDISDMKKGDVYGGWTDLTKWDRLRNLYLPSRGIRFDHEAAVPTEDVTLRNRQGWVFASLGLASSGDPGIALADSRGTVRATLFERGDFPSAWWDLAVWDKAGKMRVSLELRPEKAPSLVLFADDLGTQYVPDFGSHRLVRSDESHQSMISWLPDMQNHPRRPMRLADNRGRKIWEAP
jgi:hypothetical protein